MEGFSAIVVTCNEAKRLKECLESLAFCAEVLVYDLGSTDESVRVAKEAGATVTSLPRVPIVEELRVQVIGRAANDWIVFLDPDETFPSSRIPALVELIEKTPDLGMIGISRQFFFKGKPLDVTIWGNRRHEWRVMHRKRTELSSAVHSIPHVLPGFRAIALADTSGTDCIQHYWVDSYVQLFTKHWRYIKKEGEARYGRGERFTLRTALRDVFDATWRNLVTYRGLRGGPRGTFLSLFYSFYTAMSHLSLLAYQWRMRSRASS